MSNKYLWSRTKRLWYLGLLLVASLFSQNVYAQVSAYSFSQSSGTYSEITGGTVVTTATANTLSGSLDSYTSSAITIPFSFVYNGTTVTSSYMNSNGFLTLGTTAPTSGTTTPISGTNTATGNIAAWGGDINGVFNIGGLTSQMRYEVQGTSPSQVIIYQWKAFRPSYSTSTATAYVFDFQIKLYEGSNNIEIVYGGNLAYLIGTTSISSTRQIGLRGSSNADYNNRTNTTTVAFTSSTAGTANNNTQAFNTTALPNMPTSGLTYTWSPPAVCVSVTSGGTASSSVTSPCAAASFTLNVTGATTDAAGGITYQWYSSPDDITYNLISGATSATLATSTFAATYYKRETICAAGSSSAMSAAVLVTPAAPSSVPTNEAFATYLPTCWYEGTGVLSASTTVVAASNNWAGSNFANVAGDTGFKINLYSTNNAWVVSNQIDLGATPRQLKYNYAVTSYNGTTAQSTLGTHRVDVVISTDGGATWSNVNTVKTYTGAATYSSTGAEEAISLAAYSGVIRIGFVATTTSTSPDIDFHIDDVVVETIPTCFVPTAVVATLATSSITMNWTAPVSGTSPAGYNWELRESGAVGSGSTGLTASGSSASTSAVISSGLTLGTTYTFYVQSDCGGGDLSAWSAGTTIFFGGYDVTRSAATMTSIMSTGSTYTWQSTFSGDDNTSNTVDLTGTTFQYLGSAVTGFRACTNGWMSFNTATTSTAYINSLGGGTPNMMLAPFWDDLVVTGNLYANINNSMKYEISGTLGSGSAVITLEWAGMERFSIPGPNLNFQVKLYEATNNIEFIYGEFQGFDGTVTSAYGYTIGYNGTTPSGSTAAGRFGMVTPNTNHWAATGYSDANTVMPSCSSKYTLTPGVYTGPTSVPSSYTSAPANDNFAGSTTIATNSLPCTSFCGTYYNSRNATASVVPVPTYASSVVGAEDDDVWFDFTTSALVTDYLVRLRCAPGYDGVLQVYDGSLNEVGTCQNATTAGGIESSTVTGLATNTQYYVRVWSNTIGSGTSGEFSICASEVINPPTNDEITTATSLTPTSSCVTTSSQMPNMLAATSSGQTVNCGTATPATVADVWYSWTCLSPNDAVTVVGGTGFNPAFNIYSSSDNTATGTLTSVTCQNATGVGATETYTGTALVPGNTYFVRVYHALGGTATGNFNICVVGSSCWTPTAVTSSAVVYNGALVSWTAPANASNLDFEYAVTTTNVAPSSGTLQTSNATSVDLSGTLSPLTTYYFWVRSNCAASENSGWVSTSFTTPGTPPANDDCANAETIACGGTYTGSTVYATLDNAVASTCGGNAVTAKGVWFKYTGNDQVVTITNCFSGAYDSRISVYSGSCGALACVTGNDDDSNCTFNGFASTVSFPAYVGTDYYVLMHGWNTTTGSYVLSVSCEDLCISSNDECSTADAVAINGATVSGDNTCAYPSAMNNPSCESIYDIIVDDWYVVNSGYRTEFDVLFEEGATDPANGFWYGVELYTGTCGSLTAVSGTCQIVTFGSPNTFTGLSFNTNYYVRFYLVDPIGDGSDTGNYDVTVTGAAICSGTPTISAPTASVTSACSGVNFDLQVENVGGYLYQWQYQSGLSWVNISGGTNYILTTSQTAATNYRCRVTCIASSALTISPVINMPMNTAENCYPVSSATSDADEDIDVADFNGVSNASTCGVAAPGAGSVASQYSNFTGTPTWSFVKGEGNTFQVRVVDCELSSYYSANVAVGIDFNVDGDFADAGEVVASTATQTITSAGVTFSGTFVVPATATTGNTRMRVVAREFGGASMSGTYGYGETEDYTVTLVAPVSNDTPASAQLMSTPTYPSCANVSGTVVGATDGVAGLVGDDVWYRFTATSSAYRVATTGGSGDVALELMDATGTTSVVAAVNNNAASSDEVLVATGLTPSTIYTVRVINQSATPASFTICAQALGTSGCAYGSSYSNICSNFKSIWTGATSYSVAFTDGSNNYSGSSITTTLFGLNTVVGEVGNVLSGGLRYNTNYTATVTANYVITLAGGAGTTTVSLTGTPCSVNIGSHPAVVLRSSDRSSGVGVNPRAYNSFVAAEPWLCNVVSYDWTVQEIDPTTLTNIGLPYNFNSGSSSRYIRLNSATCAGFHTGGRYKITVAPVFAYGAGTVGAEYQLLIAGVAPGMTMEDAGTEVVLVDKINEGGVFASLYPNPNTGESVNLNIAGIESESVNISIMDASGRVVWSNRYVVDGTLFTTVNFDRPLAAGMYMVEMVYNGQVMTQRMMVQK